MNHSLRLLLLPIILVFVSCMTTEDRVPAFAESYKNTDPIILVHGLNGFERETYNNFYYWGGSLDLESFLKRAGYDVRTADIGPLSSNWDRSCELYACIKGGRVDYGEVHSREAGHERYGRVYEGLYPEWGEIDKKTGRIRQVHIISHSMGGMTARMIAQLLNEGFSKEQGHGDTSPLFTGKKDWIKSIMTISTPHDGSSLTYEFNSYRQRDMVTYLIMGFMVDWDKSFFLKNDLQLDHWTLLHKQPDESDKAYRERLSSLISEGKWNNKDFSDFDLTPEGAWEMNGWVKAQPNIYYFSWKTRITEKKTDNSQGLHPSISPILIPLADNILNYREYRSSLINIDEKWLANDGLVNTISQDGPKLNSTDIITPLGETILPGQWTYMGELFPLDHMQVLGWGISPFKGEKFQNIENWYKEQANFLTNLSL